MVWQLARSIGTNRQKDRLIFILLLCSCYRDRDNITKRLNEEHDQRRIEQMEVQSPKFSNNDFLFVGYTSFGALNLEWLINHVKCPNVSTTNFVLQKGVIFLMIFWVVMYINLLAIVFSLSIPSIKDLLNGLLKV